MEENWRIITLIVTIPVLIVGCLVVWYFFSEMMNENKKSTIVTLLVALSFVPFAVWSAILLG